MSRMFVQEIFIVKEGKTDEFQELLDRGVRPLLAEAGVALLGAWQVQMVQREFMLIWRVDGPDAFTDGGWWFKAPCLQPRAEEIGLRLEAVTERLTTSFTHLLPFIEQP